MINNNNGVPQNDTRLGRRQRDRNGDESFLTKPLGYIGLYGVDARGTGETCHEQGVGGGGRVVGGCGRRRSLLDGEVVVGCCRC